MRIKTGSRLNALVTIILGITIGSILIINVQFMDEVHRKDRIAVEIIKGTAELKIIAGEYLLYGGERIKMQWQFRYDSLSKLLTEEDFKNPEQEIILEKILHNLTLVKTIFHELVTGREKSAASQELEDRLVSLLQVRSQTMVSAAFQLHHDIGKVLMTAQQRSVWLILAILLFLTGLIAATLYWINRSIITPITRLEEGTRVIGAGNLDYRVGTVAKNEIGELSRTFDQMTEKLKITTVSREDLTKEVVERKKIERGQRLTIQILELLNQFGEDTDKIGSILRLIKEFTGFEAAGIRLAAGADFPYYETIGFPADFVDAENCLFARDEAGELICDSGGNPLLECMCGNVIRGRTDPSLPFFTEKGSFWTNSTTEFLASTTGKELQIRLRNRCNDTGYESVALIPLRSENSTIGLLQLNDSRKDMFSPELIQYIENLMSSIEIAFKRKHIEEALRKINRASRLRSTCNQLLIRAKEETELLQGVCTITVAEGGYRMAWAGFAEQDQAKTVRPVARAGYEDGYLDRGSISWADTDLGHSPTGTAIRTTKPIVCKNIMTDPDFEPWRAEAVKRGYASSISLPLTIENQTIGALNIYDVEPDGFGKDEIDLLMELANDLAYGVRALRLQAERKWADEEMRKLSHAVEQSPNAVLITDTEGFIEYANPRFTQMSGYSADEVIDKNPDDFLRSEELSFQMFSEISATMAAGKEWRGEFHIVFSDVVRVSFTLCSVMWFCPV